MEQKHLDIIAIKDELNLSVYRTGLKCSDKTINEIITDIKLKFPYKKTKYLCKVINDGGCGKYGISYKFTIQLVLYWINRQIREDKNIDML